MKLRNKKTGEMGWLYCDHISIPKKMTVFAEDKDLSANHWDYASLAELSAEWEDAPDEPKEYYCIDWTEPDGIYKTKREDARDDFNKEIGNYFDTREEAEKAVERLRAWKRLKDKGFKAFSSNICGDDFIVNFKLTNHVDYSQSIDDLDCILDFGGEEWVKTR